MMEQISGAITFWFQNNPTASRINLGDVSRTLVIFFLWIKSHFDLV